MYLLVLFLVVFVDEHLCGIITLRVGLPRYVVVYNVGRDLYLSFMLVNVVFLDCDRAVIVNSQEHLRMVYCRDRLLLASHGVLSTQYTDL